MLILLNILSKFTFQKFYTHSKCIQDFLGSKFRKEFSTRLTLLIYIYKQA